MGFRRLYWIRLDGSCGPGLIPAPRLRARCLTGLLRGLRQSPPARPSVLPQLCWSRAGVTTPREVRTRRLKMTGRRPLLHRDQPRATRLRSVFQGDA